MKLLTGERTRFGKGAVVGALVAGSLVGGIAMAAIPSADGVIHGCVAKVSGTLRIVDEEAGKKCLPAEAEVQWNQQGPPGSVGPQGPPGAAAPGWQASDIPDEVVATSSTPVLSASVSVTAPASRLIEWFFSIEIDTGEWPSGADLCYGCYGVLDLLVDGTEAKHWITGDRPEPGEPAGFVYRSPGGVLMLELPPGPHTLQLRLWATPELGSAKFRNARLWTRPSP